MRNRGNSYSFSLATVLLLAGTALAARGFKGAETIVREVLAGRGEHEDTSADVLTRLRADIDAFPKIAPTLAPAEAARAWLKLVDRMLAIPPGELLRRHVVVRSGFDREPILAALPPPTAWPDLEKLVAARPATAGVNSSPELGLRILAHTLTANTAARAKDLAALQALKTSAKTGNAPSYLASDPSKLDRALFNSVQDSDELVKLLIPELKLESDSDLELPDLVTTLGPERAEKFLRAALTGSKRELRIARGDETAALARKLALELIDQLSIPQWNLAGSLDGAALYEALEKRFPDAAAMEKDGDSLRSAHRSARVHYLCALIVTQRTDEAVRFANSLEPSEFSDYQLSAAVAAAEEAGSTAALDDFFHQLLAQHPALPFWDHYVQVSAQAGQAERMLTLARATAGQPPVAGKAGEKFRSSYYKALLAADQVEEGVAEMQKLARDSGSAGTRGETGIKLARIGQLLGNNSWIQAGLTIARTENDRTHDSYDLARQLAWLLFQLDRGGEAEQVLGDALESADRTPDPSALASFFENTNQAGSKLSGDLALIYADAGSNNDVLTLLAQAPWWGASDLAEIYDRAVQPETATEFSAHAPADDSTIGCLAAAALARRGDKKEARRIIDAVLDRRGDFDPAYELRVALGGGDLLARLDQLFARDQFEERPLIWKAVVLFQKHQLAEAEEVVRHAIAIDPSDGDQGPGRRMRAYGVLADILAARGDQAGARENRAAVAAIRLSEKADRFYEAGLLTRAVAIYRAALGHFENAYCIQSRLALREAELGHYDQAEAHYRKAYELMPDSFGRVESHCFGCERAFAGKRAESIADKVFTRLVTTTPDKPQIHYLLGYLREEEGRYREALPEFEKAVQLDPEYLNAWKHIQSTGAHLQIPAARRDAVIQNIVRLDPLARHGWGDLFAEAGDLRATWNAVAAANEKEPARPDTLLPLPASKAAQAVETPQEKSAQLSPRFEFSERTDRTTPAEAIAQNHFVALAGGLFGWDALMWQH